ncbi:glutaminase [Streptomyces sp. H10-C2]|uniref:glutaminase n=1 Tax=unclassified Streptomyces TaxID=2593676 RepID=UPI0024BA10AC|nr:MULTISPECIES: glutaminase [unclassified Streptomyces]MDJ0343601.1 glutaminase [Streptomyces sp. PH10-H1]MDJ0373151.1 glutaminase [Streptomyces sp. H10-C2]
MLKTLSRGCRRAPSGEAFNAISLDAATGRPANPMINAGAIAVTALVPAADAGARFARIRDCLSAFAGRRLGFDEYVYRSEVATGHRNRALAHLMRAAGSLRGDPVEAVETYFRQCAVLATVTDLAVMAATLANGGVNPMTGVAVVPEPVAVQVLSVMATCGMYDAAGEWMLRVGLPAKSGVSGGLVAASPARFGLGVHSPPLDASGNPVRGVAALRELSGRLGLHLMHNAAPGAATVTAATTAGQARSDRPRTPNDNAVLQRHGDRIALVAAQGALDFTAAERVLYALGQSTPAVPGWVVLDLERVTAVDATAGAMLERALALLAERGHDVGVTGTFLKAGSWRRAATRDLALARAEDALLASAAAG